jgi:hypothetical protein
MTASAYVSRVESRPEAREQRHHLEIEWRGAAGSARSGVWYDSTLAAEGMAQQCGAKDVMQ